MSAPTFRLMLCTYGHVLQDNLTTLLDCSAIRMLAQVGQNVSMIPKAI